MAELTPSAYAYAREQVARAHKNGHLPDPQGLTREWLIAELEHAGQILQRMPSRGARPADYGSSWPDMVHDAATAYGWTSEDNRPPKPNAQDIARMDRAYAWIGLLPEGKRVWRRLILLRSLVHWQSERHKWSWRKIERQWGSSDTYWKYQWEFAIDTLLVNIIEGRQKC